MNARAFRYLAVALGLAMVLLIGGAQAGAPGRPFWARSAVAPAYSLSFEDEAGSELPSFVAGGRTFVLGERGQRYAIRVRNPGPRRVEAVLSVDGRDVVSGRLADYVRERGYVVPAHGSLLVEGFRRSREEVAAFRFSSPEASYSARLGTAQFVGVVGAAFFPERPPRPLSRSPRPPYRPEAAPEHATEARDSSAPAPRRARATDQHLGTEFGEPYASRVSSLSFEREFPRHPAQVLTLHYDDAAGLSARGIDVSAYLGQENEEQAFPGLRFAEPPP